MSADSLYKNYRANGFLFDDDLVTRYTLSLYTKPLVILSGISGTGKSKLAQLFDPPLNIEFSDEEEDLDDDEGFIAINMTKGILYESGRGNFRFSDIDEIYEEDELPEIREKIQKLKEEGVDDNITDLERIYIETPDGEELTAAVYLQRARNPLLRVRFKSKRGSDNPYNSMEYLADRYEVDDVIGLEKIGKRKFRISSENDEKVISQEAKRRKKELQNIDNQLFVSVKNNWTDSSEIFGFYNIIEDRYHITETLNFLLKAKENPEIPFFLILDEMNLSKVEHYFSDFLSCVESRLQDDGVVNQEKVILHSKGAYAESDDLYFDLIPSKIEIPTNLYVTGTVNIDESTYMFSPKVLDRANVIEFNEVDLSSYQEEGIEESDSNFRLSNIPNFGNIEIASKKHFEDAPKILKDVLIELNEILKSYNLHFGYRTVNEISLFVSNSLSHIQPSDVGEATEVIKKAIDYQIYQKILPKLNGSYSQLEEPLRKIISFLLNDDIPYENIDHGSLNSIQLDDEDYPNSLKKLKIMYRNLKTNGFTSFLE